MSRQRDVPAVLAEIFGGGAPPASSEESARTPDALASVSTLTAPVAHAVPRPARKWRVPALLDASRGRHRHADAARIGQSRPRLDELGNFLRIPPM